MKAIRKTMLSCGLLNAPVKIYAAAGTEPEIRFNLCGPNGEPVDQVYIPHEEESEYRWADDEKTERIVQIFSKGELGSSYNGTMISQADLAIADEDSMEDENGNDLSTIQIERFVPIKSVPSERGIGLYYIGPDKALEGKSFETFKAALKRKRVAGIAKVVVRKRQMLLAIYERDGVVMAQRLNFFDTLTPRDNVDLTDSRVKVRKDEVSMMGNLIDAYMTDADEIDGMKDSYVEAKREIVEKIVKDGTKPSTKEKSKKKPRKDDSLMKQLEVSVKAAQEKVKV